MIRRGQLGALFVAGRQAALLLYWSCRMDGSGEATVCVEELLNEAELSDECYEMELYLTSKEDRSCYACKTQLISENPWQFQSISALELKMD